MGIALQVHGVLPVWVLGIAVQVHGVLPVWVSPYKYTEVVAVVSVCPYPSMM